VYYGTGDKVLLHSVEQRLIDSRLLLGRRGASVEVQRKRRLHDILFSDDTVKYIKFFREADKDLRKEYEGALNANTSFQRLLSKRATDHDIDKLLRSGFKMSTNGVEDFTREHGKFLTTGDNRFITLRDVYFPEDMFISEEVGIHTILKVGGIPLQATLPRGVELQVTTSEIGLWKISGSMLEWANNKLDQLKILRDENKSPIPYKDLLPIFSEDLEWVNDDLGLIAKALDVVKGLRKAGSFVWLISADEQLAFRMAQTIKIPVARVRPEDVIIQLHGSQKELKDINSEWLMDTFPYNKKRYKHSAMVPVDTGSMAATLINYDEMSVKRVLVSEGENLNGKRVVKHRLEKVGIHKAAHPMFYTV
jgi:hypothetical protein